MFTASGKGEGIERERWEGGGRERKRACRQRKVHKMATMRSTTISMFQKSKTNLKDDEQHCSAVHKTTIIWIQNPGTVLFSVSRQTKTTNTTERIFKATEASSRPFSAPQKIQATNHSHWNTLTLQAPPMKTGQTQHARPLSAVLIGFPGHVAMEWPPRLLPL